MPGKNSGSIPIIDVKNISKFFNIGQDKTYKTLSGTITKAIVNPVQVFKEMGKQYNTFWALKKINFQVERGEVIGIIGKNGAGKSTLLKILSRITSPTAGEIRLRGRVGSLLEVGTGFHSELTGRENIFFNGAILGMKKREIDDKFDEIVKFSGVEKFLDTPVKRYSSGMNVRLAFSVAANLDPEILLIDEVLAVGDSEFQKKCLGKMGEVAQGGRTVIFVSHNMEAIRKLCSRGILIESGEIKFDGDTEFAVNDYLSVYNIAQNEYLFDKPSSEISAWVSKVIFEDINGKPCSSFPVGKPWQARIFLRVEYDIGSIFLSFATLKNGFNIAITWSKARSYQKGEYQILFIEKNIFYTPGRYQFTFSVRDFAMQRIHHVNEFGVIEITPVTDGLDLPYINMGLILNQMDCDIQEN